MFVVHRLSELFNGGEGLVVAPQALKGGESKIGADQ
jgi:hypothetical protein